MDACLLTHINIDGGSRDREATEEAVMACFFPSDCEEIILTEEVMPLIEVKNPL